MSRDSDIYLNPEMDHDNYRLYEDLALPIKKYFKNLKLNQEGRYLSYHKSIVIPEVYFTKCIMKDKLYDLYADKIDDTNKNLMIKLRDNYP